jgi:hypothetical protein
MDKLLTVSALPAKEANQSGVTPSLLAALTFAPAASSVRTSSTLPFLQALNSSQSLGLLAAPTAQTAIARIRNPRKIAFMIQFLLSLF